MFRKLKIVLCAALATFFIIMAVIAAEKLWVNPSPPVFTTEEDVKLPYNPAIPAIRANTGESSVADVLPNRVRVRYTNKSAAHNELSSVTDKRQ
jgi:hypothetical protein